MKQIKYAFWPMQYSKDQVEQKRITLNDPTWRQPPLLIVNVSSYFYFVAISRMPCYQMLLTCLVLSDNG